VGAGCASGVAEAAVLAQVVAAAESAGWPSGGATAAEAEGAARTAAGRCSCRPWSWCPVRPPSVS